jgi:hypothetical protein
MNQTKEKGATFKLPQINSIISLTKATTGGHMFVVIGIRKR